MVMLLFFVWYLDDRFIVQWVIAEKLSIYEITARCHFTDNNLSCFTWSVECLQHSRVSFRQYRIPVGPFFLLLVCPSLCEAGSLKSIPAPLRPTAISVRWTIHQSNASYGWQFSRIKLRLRWTDVSPICHVPSVLFAAQLLATATLKKVIRLACRPRVSSVQCKAQRNSRIFNKNREIIARIFCSAENRLPFESLILLFWSARHSTNTVKPRIKRINWACCAIRGFITRLIYKVFTFCKTLQKMFRFCINFVDLQREGDQYCSRRIVFFRTLL